jgi:hypothetical protein
VTIDTPRPALRPAKPPRFIAAQGAPRLPAHLPPQAMTASQRIGQAMSEKAVGSGKVSAEDVAHMVLEAVAADRFYIYSHPKALGNVRLRVDAMLNGDNPPDPFAERPEIGAQLRQALQG